MRRTLTPVLAATLLLTACGGGGGDPAVNPATSNVPAASATPSTASTTGDDLASCYAGEGTAGGKHLYATLRLVRGAGDAVTGTYLVGETKAGGMPYAVTGSLKNGKLDSVFTAAGQGLNVTGEVTTDRVALDNPDGSFSVTKFSAGC